jgi:hypothetical protein
MRPTSLLTLLAPWRNRGYTEFPTVGNFLQGFDVAEFLCAMIRIQFSRRGVSRLTAVPVVLGHDLRNHTKPVHADRGAYRGVG